MGVAVSMVGDNVVDADGLLLGLVVGDAVGDIVGGSSKASVITGSVRTPLVCI